MKVELTLTKGYLGSGETRFSLVAVDRLSGETLVDAELTPQQYAAFVTGAHTIADDARHGDLGRVGMVRLNTNVCVTAHRDTPVADVRRRLSAHYGRKGMSVRGPDFGNSHRRRRMGRQDSSLVSYMVVVWAWFAPDEAPDPLVLPDLRDDDDAISFVEVDE